MHLRSSALELTLQNFVNLCNQRPPEGIRMHQIRFTLGFCPDPAAGAHDAPQTPLSDGEGDNPSPYPPRRLRHLGLGACWFVLQRIFRSRAPVGSTYYNIIMPRPRRAETLSDVLSDVCLSRTSGLIREQRGLGRLKLAQS